jgi:hypothetical protein
LNTRWTPRFNAFMTPIRAILVGPLRDTSINTSIVVSPGSTGLNVSTKNSGQIRASYLAAKHGVSRLVVAFD